VIHIFRGRLRGVTITCQYVYCFAYCHENGEKPSAHNPSLTLHGSNAKLGYVSSKYFHASPSDGWQNSPGSRGFS